MTMYNPAHPGAILRDQVIAPLGLTVSETAQRLNISSNTLSLILECKAAIDPQMAIRLEMLFGQSADLWIRMQASYDLWQARQEKGDFHITPYNNQPALSIH